MILPYFLLVVGTSTTQADFHRIQPRSVEASSYLESQWNRYDENYLPIYAVDDDPKTAWVEGEAGLGVGAWLEWLGPHLTKARQVELRVRAGYHKSKALYRANARPTVLRIQPMSFVDGEYWEAGEAAQVSLPDRMQVHVVRLPVPANFAGLRLQLVDAARGARYLDTCLSDLQVFVDAGDTYRPALEARAFEALQARILERVALARAKAPSGVRYGLARGYLAGPGRALAVPKGAELGRLAPLVAMAEAAGLEDGLPEVQAVMTAVDGAPESEWRLVTTDGDPRLGVQLVAALPALQSRFVGLYGLNALLDREQARLQDLDASRWAPLHTLWMEKVEGDLLYEVVMPRADAERLVRGARDFGYRGRLADVFKCSKTDCTLDQDREAPLVAVGRRRLAPRYEVLGGLRTPRALRVEVQRTLDSGRDGGYGDIHRREVVVYGQDGLPVGLFLVAEFRSEGGLGPDHAQLFLLGWAGEGQRRLVQVDEVHLVRTRRAYEGGAGTLSARTRRWRAKAEAPPPAPPK